MQWAWRATRRRESVYTIDAPLTQQTNTPALPRRNSTTSSRPARHMASSVDDSSEYDSGPPSQPEDHRVPHRGNGATNTPGADREQNEDLFLNIAADSAPRQRAVDAPARIDRLKVSASFKFRCYYLLPSVCKLCSWHHLTCPPFP